MGPGFGWRVAVSAVVGLGWLIFLVWFLFFYAQNFTVYQNLAILVMSILVVGAILAPIWILWGIKTARAWEKKGARKRKR
ncbi:MAG: hypothetical protein AB1305_00565 [Candidatus Hadarchaeota archaeon]